MPEFMRCSWSCGPLIPRICTSAIKHRVLSSNREPRNASQELKSLDVVSERLHQPACCQANIFVVIYDRYEGSRLHGHLPCRGFTSQALGRNSIEIMLPQLIK